MCSQATFKQTVRASVIRVKRSKDCKAQPNIDILLEHYSWGTIELCISENTLLCSLVATIELLIGFRALTARNVHSLTFERLSPPDSRAHRIVLGCVITIADKQNVTTFINSNKAWRMHVYHNFVYIPCQREMQRITKLQNSGKQAIGLLEDYILK